MMNSELSGSPMLIRSEQTRLREVTILLLILLMMVGAGLELTHANSPIIPILVLVFGGLIVFVKIKMIFNPPVIQIQNGRVLFPSGFPAPLDFESIDSIWHDGSLMSVVLKERFVDQLPAKVVDRMKQAHAKEYRHFIVPGFPFSQIESIRVALQQSKPDETTAGGRIELFQERLIARQPVPRITNILVLTNVIVFLCMIYSGVSASEPKIQDLLDWGANFGPLTMDGQPWRLFTSMFIHIGILHLLFNMSVLIDLGTLIERLLGPFALLALYLSAGLFGSLGSLAWNATMVSAGASGAIFGLLGGLIIMLVLNREQIPLEVLKRFQNSLLMFLVFSFYLGFASAQIDHAAHVGGLVSGAIGGLILSLQFSWQRKGQPAYILAGWLVASLMGLYLGFHELNQKPSSVLTWDRTIREFAAVEVQLITRYDQGAVAAQKQELNDFELANLIDLEILPKWSEYHDRFVQIQANWVGKPVPKTLDFLNYLRVRQEAFEKISKGLRNGDGALFQEGNQKMRESIELAKILSARS
jgi:membrane associated rhomboid family serine protease